MVEGQNVTFYLKDVHPKADILVQSQPWNFDEPEDLLPDMSQLTQLSDHPLPRVRETFAWPLCACHRACSSRPSFAAGRRRDTMQFWTQASVNHSNDMVAVTFPLAAHDPARQTHQTKAKVFLTELAPTRSFSTGYTLVNVPPTLNMDISLPQSCFLGEQIEVTLRVSSGWKHRAQMFDIVIQGEGHFSLPNRTKVKLQRMLDLPNAMLSFVPGQVLSCARGTTKRL